MARIGVLALQGGFAAHQQALSDLGHSVVEVRDAATLEGLQGLVLPGGESTTQLKLLAGTGLRAALDRFVASGRPVLVTCAGVVLAAGVVRDPEQQSLGWLDVTVSRNAWGRQVHSFEALADDGELPLVFIRAPRILKVGPGVRVLATFEGEPVLVKQGNVTGATFHPELTSSPRVHREAFVQDEQMACAIPPT